MLRDDEHDPSLWIEWDWAKQSAKRGDPAPLVKLLRKLYQPDALPDLLFIAELLEGKFNKAKGRPADGKITAGLKQLTAGRAVDRLIKTQELTVEQAVEKAAKTLPMSESAIKKHYLYCLRDGLLDSPGGDDEEELSDK